MVGTTKYQQVLVEIMNMTIADIWMWWCPQSNTLSDDPDT